MLMLRERFGKRELERHLDSGYFERKVADLKEVWRKRTE